MERSKPNPYSANRDLVDQHKDALRNQNQWDALSQPPQHEMAPMPPTTLQKFGRAILNLTPVKMMFPEMYRVSNEQRDREARYVARQEHLAEQEIENARFLEEENQRHERERAEEEVRRREREEREQQDFERDLVGAMDQYRARKIEQQQGERIQEMSERAFNERLTKLEEIDVVAETGGMGIEKRQMEHDGKMLTVYDMQGFPFNFLQHAIDFKGRGETDNEHRSGSQLAKDLQDNPALWAEKRSDDGRYGGRLGDSKANTISTSYVNTSENFRTIDSNAFLYGFDHVRPDSILQVSGGDGATTSGIGESKTYLGAHDSYMPEQLESAGIKSNYNEVQLRRYDEVGNPQLPDYVIIKDGRASDVILQHAAFFNIPIVNIETKYYKEQEAVRLGELIDSIDENSSYEEIRQVFERCTSSYLVGESAERKLIGQWDEHPHKGFYYNEELTQKVETFAKFEAEKRVEFMKQKLQQAIEDMRVATAKGEHLPFTRGIEKVEKQTYGEGWSGVAKHRLDIAIRLELQQPRIEAEIYDGDNPSELNSIPYEGANSRDYNELAPIVEEYLEALEKNKIASGANW